MEQLLLTKRAKYNVQKVYVDGVLSISRVQLTWQPNEPGAAAPLTVETASITGQQQVKDKALLRVATLVGAHIFLFRSAQDRDEVLAALAPVVQAVQAKGKQPVGGAAPDPAAAISGPSAPLKRKLLDENKDLAQLYKELVGGGVVTDAEFWRGREELLRRHAPKHAAQQVGLSSALPNVRVEASPDGQSDRVRVVVTPAVKQQIFAEQPHVKAAFAASVPHSMPEEAFWIQYYKHQLRQQRRRITAAEGSQGGARSMLLNGRADEDGDDLFARFAEMVAGEAPPPAARMRAVDPAVDLAADSFDGFSQGYGLLHNASKDAAGPQSKLQTDLIATINRHASLVMKGAAAAEPAQEGMADADAQRLRDSGDLDARRELYQRSGSALEDLRADAAGTYATLNIQDPRRCFTPGASPAVKASPSAAVEDRRPLAEIVRSLQAAMPTAKVLSPDIALQALKDIQQQQHAVEEEGLGAGGEVVNGSPAEELIPSMLALLRQTAMTVNELLRYFWAAFRGARTPARTSKLERLKQVLSDQYDKIEAMQRTATGTERVHITRLLRPLMQALDAAFARYDKDQEQRAAKQGS